MNMVEYSEYRLGLLCKRFSSGKGISADLINETGKYPVIGGNGLRGYTDTYNFDGECAVIGRQGAYCGNVQFFSGKGYMTEHAVVTQPNSANNAKYLTYKLSGLSLGRFSGQAAQPGLSVTKLARLRIEMPPKWYQDRVAGILSAYDNLIEVNNKRIKVLEQIAENLYKEWFVRFRFPGHEKADFENGIPKGWRRGRISEFYTTSSGGTPSRELDEYYVDGTIPWIKTGELQDCLLIDTEERITEVAVKKSSAKFFPKDSVLMAMYGVNIGMLAYSTMDATCNQACCVFRDKGNISTKHYLFQCLKSIRDYLLLISFGAAQQNLSQDLIKRVRIVMPDEETVIRFEQKIEPLYNEIKHLLKANACLIRQRDLLLPRLMSGKLEVQYALND